MQPEEAQAQPKAQNALHDPTVAGPREEVQGEAVLERRRESRVLVVVASHGDAGKRVAPNARRNGVGDRVSSRMVIADGLSSYALYSRGTKKTGFPGLGDFPELPRAERVISRRFAQVLLGSRLISEWAVNPRRLVGRSLYGRLKFTDNFIEPGQRRRLLSWILNSSLVVQSN